MIDLRVRSEVSADGVEAMLGKLPSDAEYDVMLMGAATVRKPDGGLLCIYLPAAIPEALAEDVRPVLSGIRMESPTTANRGMAAGTPRVFKGERKRGETRPVHSTIVGAVDPSTTYRYCRLTLWSGSEAEKYRMLFPLLEHIGGLFATYVPDRYAAQMARLNEVRPEWKIPGTPFTTLTVNNSYATGVHYDKGDLPEGFSNITCFRAGGYEGGRLVFPRYRVAVDLQDRDVILMDAHEAHGNTPLTCPHSDGPLMRPCREGCERVSVVAYMRTKMVDCGTAAEEQRRAAAWADSRSKFDTP